MQVSDDDTYPRLYAVCPGCTLMAVRLAYGRHPWFRLVRGPLWLGMWLLSWWHGFDADDYIVRNRFCRGCLRFRKNILTEHSPLFRFLNARIAGPFGRALGGLTEGIDHEAKLRFAQASTFRTMDELRKGTPDEFKEEPRA